VNNKARVVAIVGPTAVGKTEMSIEIASVLDAEIVSIDSRLIYRGMDIGTAKPSREQRKRVRHHMIDLADPGELWSMARFKSQAGLVIQEILHRQRLPLLVGGTGQYLRAILHGWQPPPASSDSTMREEFERFAEEKGFERLHARLEEIDPKRASQIDPRNVRRVVRALEIYQVTGRRPSELAQMTPPPFDTLVIGLQLPREELYKRIDQRIEWMFESGFVEEVKELHLSKLHPDSPALSAIGYLQTMAFLDEQMSLEEVKSEMRRLTRQFVRRQANWFKSDDPSIQWFRATPANIIVILEHIRNWLDDPQVGLRESESGSL
jgi:tRNA dimethylallyltransferase